MNYRDKVRGGVLSSFDDLKAGVDPLVVTALRMASFFPTLASGTSRS